MLVGPLLVDGTADEDVDGTTDGLRLDVDVDEPLLVELGELVVGDVLTGTGDSVELAELGVGAGVGVCEADETSTRLGVGVGWLRAAVVGAVMTPTMVGAGFGAGRTSR